MGVFCAFLASCLGIYNALTQKITQKKGLDEKRNIRIHNQSLTERQCKSKSTT